MTPPAPLAGRVRRALAATVDLLLVPALTLFLVMVFGVVEDAEDYASQAWIGWVLVLAVAAYLILNGYWLWRGGQTLGKRLLSIRMVAPDGSRAPFWKLLCIRALFFPLTYLVVLWPVTVLPVLDQALIFTRRRRCLHDLAAGTVVVLARPDDSCVRASTGSTGGDQGVSMAPATGRTPTRTR